ncbi:hypothetical protein [Photobacterium phosphoreum]|uniref:hypothetical protein n=1 Tax=Photobacterium phosphoreum TaxID=659 RepID=UPI0039AE97A9
MQILDVEFDNVIDGIVAIGSAPYEYAYSHLIPLIDKTDFQRKLQDKSFYRKLQRDLTNGCVMPPITIAFVSTNINSQSTPEQVNDYVLANITSAFVLDGIQRLNTLSRLDGESAVDLNKKIYINFVFCSSIEKLLYRMITLNNGQRPMTPRHQVETIMRNVFNFEEMGIVVESEKNSNTKGAFKKADLIQGYLAFMADKPMVDNKKIIQEKMDELLVNKIMAENPSSYNTKFESVLLAIQKFQSDPTTKKWLLIANNFVGFSVGMKHSADAILDLSIAEFRERIEIFDSAFSDFNPSKIKVGKLRRELSCEYFKNFQSYRHLDSDELLELFAEMTPSD